MMRSLMIIALAWPLAVSAAGRPASLVCSDAGFRPGTANFDICVSRIEGDDPLAGLEQSLDDERIPAEGKPVRDDALVIPEPGRPAVAPVKPPVRDGEFPSVTGSNFSGPPPAEPPPPVAPPPPSYNNGGMTMPTPPTAPEITTFTITVPAWTWGGQ